MTDTTVSRRRFLSQVLSAGAGAIVGGASVGNIINYWTKSQNASPDAPLQGLQIPPVTLTTASGIHVHHIQTGYVAVKEAHRAHEGRDGMGILAIALDNQWTEWMPISVWVIEHPEGVIVIDTGETARTSEPDYYQSVDAVFYGSFLRFAVTLEDEIASQLQLLGIPPQDVRWVVQTHLHGDHIGGMGAFPNAEFLISSEDYPMSTGALPYHYPDWLNPTFTQFNGEPVTGFDGSYALTQAEDVLIVPTSGHSGGHQSVILRADDTHFFFAGDASFDQNQMLSVITAGIVADPAQSRNTLQRIQDYTSSHPTVYLPSHDPESRSRLLNQTIVS